LLLNGFKLLDAENEMFITLVFIVTKFYSKVLNIIWKYFFQASKIYQNNFSKSIRSRVISS